MIFIYLIIGLLIACFVLLWSAVKTGENADAYMERLLKKKHVTYSMSKKEYVYKKYLEVFTLSEVFGQTTEEAAELIQALNKLLRSLKQTTPTKYADAYENLVEEIADVSIMLDIVRKALEIKDADVEKVQYEKLRRQELRTAIEAERRGICERKKVLSSTETKAP